MTPSLLLAVAMAGACGAAARFSVDYAVSRPTSTAKGLGTVIVNVSGSFGLGLLMGIAMHGTLPEPLIIAIGVGFLGAYTTFSTWMYETARLVQQRAWSVVVVNVVVPLVAGPIAALAGLWLARPS